MPYIYRSWHSPPEPSLPPAVSNAIRTLYFESLSCLRCLSLSPFLLTVLDVFKSEKERGIFVLFLMLSLLFVFFNLQVLFGLVSCFYVIVLSYCIVAPYVAFPKGPQLKQAYRLSCVFILLNFNIQ